MPMLKGRARRINNERQKENVSVKGIKDYSVFIGYDIR